nr:PREDICTED: chymotrypsin-1-like [Linepithema humile]
MLFLAVIFVIGVFAQQTFADAPEAIVGGERAAPGEFPWQCSLRVNGQHFCGCSIIGPKQILTAAHCVEGICVSPNKCTIDTGMINVDKGQSHEIHNITIHPRYDGRREASWVNDIAVIILKNAIKFSNVQRPIKLTDKRPTPGTMCTLSGWGDTKAGGPSSKELLKMKQAVVGQDECREAFYGQQPINKKPFVHPNYVDSVSESWVNDVAVITFNKQQSPICLADSPPVAGMKCTLSGWSIIRANGPLPTYLLKMEQALVTNEQCEQDNRMKIYPSHLCAYNKRGIGACQGDSGGPLVCNGRQYGITFWVLPCARGVPDAYTSVYHHRDFIRSS